MAPPESVPSATVTDLATARRGRIAGAGKSGVRAAAARTAESGAVGKRTATPRKPANRRFDTEKVERLKEEIAQGRYEIDPSSVADRFIEHERNG